jgi:hypothetical protein
MSTPLAPSGRRIGNGSGPPSAVYARNDELPLDSTAGTAATGGV